MSGKITITGIQGFGYHGLFESEKRDGQNFIVDIQVEVDLDKAGVSDQLEASLDYNALAVLVHEEIIGLPVNLIEALAHRIGEKILKSFKQVEGIKVTVHKPQAPIEVSFSDVSVTIELER